MSDAIIQFRNAMQEAFGPLDWLPTPDGGIHRFRVPDDKPGTLNGWYVLFLDGIASGAFGSWKAGGSQSWSSREPANQAEAELIRRRIDNAKLKREMEQRERQGDAAVEAARVWIRSTPVIYHPYLIRKGVKPHGLRQRGGALLVPLYVGDRLVNLQRIYPDGAKRFLAGGRVKGAYSPIGVMEPDATLYLCEGWATGATIHEETGHPVACAMNAGNLLEVGQHLRQEHPDNLMVIAGDDDRLTEGNPGKTAAIKAAATLGCGLVLPPWPADAPPDLTDFNDLACWRRSHENT